MGYDMTQVTEHPHAKQHREALQVERENAERVLKTLADAGRAGDWLTPEERSTLSETEQADLEKERATAWRKAWLDSEEGKNFGSYDELMEAELKARTIPPTEKYLEARREHSRLIMKEPKHSAYFRLNIWGMSRYCGVMEQLGMLKATAKSDKFPEPPMDRELSWALDAAQEYAEEDVFEHAATDERSIETVVRTGVASDRWKNDYPQHVGQVTDEVITAYVAYRDQVQAHLSQHDPKVRGIDVIKFSTNDGWHVTKEECASAVQVWDELPEDLRKGLVEGTDGQPGLGDYWLSWIEYLRDGAVGNGFKVH